MDLVAKVHDRLSADAVLAAGLATYHGQPAVYTAIPVPPDTGFPFISLSVDADEKAPNKTQRMRDASIRIAVFAEATGSALTVDQLAARIDDICDRLPFPPENGWRNYAASVSGPEIAPTDPDIYGRELILRLLLIRDNPQEEQTDG